MRHLLYIAALLAVSISSGCRRGGSDSTVPRPIAYPRIQVPDSAYNPVDVSGVTLMVNKSADVNVSSNGKGAWIDVAYGGFATPRLYLTLTECTPGETEGVMANRHERMDLNIGGQRCELTELTTPNGWQCELAVARGAMVTPVQILAGDRTRVLSGALTLSLPDSLLPDPLAVAPIVDAIARDMLVMLKGL